MKDSMLQLQLQKDQGCIKNCFQMCCKADIHDQDEIYQRHLKKNHASATSYMTSVNMSVEH